MTQVEQWARVRRLGDGDEMRASALNFDAEDRRDSTFVRVCSFLNNVFSVSVN